MGSPAGTIKKMAYLLLKNQSEGVSAMGKFCKHFSGLIFAVLFCLAALTLPVAAEDNFGFSSGPIMKIDLGVTELTLKAGDSYTFSVQYEPKDPVFPWLNWFVTDDTVVSIDPETSTLTALAAGYARILAEDSDGVAYAFCDVTVAGARAYDTGEKTAGSSLVDLSDEDREKITAPALKRFMDFVGDSTLSRGAAAQAAERNFAVPASVKPGTEEAQAKRALSHGMEKAEPLTHLHLVTIQGTFEQILAFAAGNPDLIEIFDLLPVYTDDPAGTEDDPLQKTVTLEGNVEGLTSVSTAHDLGFTGRGALIAVLDSGLNKGHKEFKNRVKYQACFSTGMTSGNTVYSSVCSGAKSAALGNAKNKDNFNHGSHVAGIMAGKGGIAPEADIIAVQIFSEKCNKKASAKTCPGKVILPVDELAAFDYLLDLNDSGVSITAVNMSFGGSAYQNVCDTVRIGSYGSLHSFIKQLVSEGGMIPVAASGNAGYPDKITQPACDSLVFAVGALEDTYKPEIKYFSNHNKLIDMLAPGTDIYSASYTRQGGKYYMKMSGTSMATPMVTGAFAILKQIYPYNSPADLENLLKLITEKSANYRNAGEVYDEDHNPIPVPAETFSFSKPVLNFGMLGDFVCPAVTEENMTVEGISSGFLVTVPYDPDASYAVEVFDPDTEKYIEDLTYSSEKDPYENNLFITVTGVGLVNDHIYNVKVTPYTNIKGTDYYRESAIVSAMPAEPVSLTVKPLAAGAQFTAVNPSPETRIRFFVYEAESGKPVKTVTPSGTVTAGRVSGLKNGRLYYAAAQTYKAVTRKNTVGGAVSAPVYFVPMDVQGGIKIKWNGTASAEITASADKKAAGFRVLYRPADGDFTNGCQVPYGTPCIINGLDKDSAYDFYVMKYAEIEGKTHPFYGPGVVKTYKSSTSGLPAPDSPEITISADNKASVKISRAKKAEGISVLFRWGNRNDFEIGCEADGDSCTIADVIHTDPNLFYTFYVMQYKTLKEHRVYSPGAVVYNFIGPKSADPAAAGDETEIPDVYAILKNYMTEEDVILEEVSAVMNESPADEWSRSEKLDFLRSVKDAGPEEAIEEEPAEEKTAGITEIEVARDFMADDEDPDWEFDEYWDAEETSALLKNFSGDPAYVIPADRKPDLPERPCDEEPDADGMETQVAQPGGSAPDHDPGSSSSAPRDSGFRFYRFWD